MEQEATLGLVAVTAILFGGILLYGLLVRATFGVRVKLFERANALLEASECTQDERAFINYLLDTAMSFKAGWAIPRAIMRTTFKKVRKEVVTVSCPVDRVISLMLYYLVSVMVANPIAFLCALLGMPLLIIAGLREHEKPQDALRDAAREVRVPRARKFAY